MKDNGLKDGSEKEQIVKEKQKKDQRIKMVAK